MPWNEGLTGTAINIAATTASPLRVLAGPGTGKSFAMKRRVARLLETGSNPKRILAVTFTRTAAADLKREVATVGVEGSDEVRAGTLHGFCFSVLSAHSVFQHTQRAPRPLIAFPKSGVLQFEAGPMLADLNARTFGSDRDKTKRIWAFEAAWARLQSETPGWPNDPVDHDFHNALVAWLRFHRAMILGELVPEALRYLKNNPAAPELSDYDHVVVDEYQDLNKAEQELIDLLAASGSLAIVGDEDQSIYRFRHANPEGIVTFNATHPGTHDESLAECRRCPRRVVAIANQLILQNHPPGNPPRLVPRAANPEGNVHLIQWATLAEEVTGLADYVKHRVDGGAAPKDILVLSPRRKIGYDLRDALLERGINAHSFYNEEPFEADEAQSAFALLTLAGRPGDRVAYRFLLGAGSPSWHRREYRRLGEACEQTTLDPFQFMEEVAAQQRMLQGTAQLLANHIAIKDRLGALQGLHGGDLIDAIFPSGQPWSEGVREAWETVAEGDEEPKKVLELLRAELTHPEVPEGEFARVMSLHKSKGLTSPIVIVTSCVEGLIPFIDPNIAPAQRAEAEREQRRLFYVALTRPTETLILSSCIGVERALAFSLGMQVTGGRAGHVRAIASRFFGELGPSASAAKAGIAWRAGAYV